MLLNTMPCVVLLCSALFQMPHSFGYRARTRDMFSRPFRQAGVLPLSANMKSVKVCIMVHGASSGLDRAGLGCQAWPTE